MPRDDEPRICCPVEVRGLYAVAFNLLNLRTDPDRWERKIQERLDELQSAVTELQPFIDAHFANTKHALKAWKHARKPGTHQVPELEALIVAVRALDPAAADTQAYGEWDAAKWAVFNAAVRFVKEQH